MPSPTLRRALIVIDVQNEYVTGQLRITHPPLSTSLPNIVQAIEGARATGVPVVFVQNSLPSDSPLFARDSHAWQLHADVAQFQPDHYVDKHLPSAFAGTDLESWLRAQDIQVLSVVGYMTHNCVDATVRHAVHLGFGAEVLEDATGSVDYVNRAGGQTAQQLHEAFMVVLHSRFANVVSTAQWLGTLNGADLPPPGSILASHRDALRALNALSASQAVTPVYEAL